MPLEKSKPATRTSQNVKITVLEAKKEHLFEILQEIYNLSLKIDDPVNKSKFLARVQSLDKTRTEFSLTLDELTIAYVEENPSIIPNYSSLNAFDELYCHIKCTEDTLKLNSKVDSNADLYNIKLPPLQLTSFDGTPTKWQVFYETFKVIIHDNYKLSKAEKCQYLVGRLTGKALIVCSGIPPTAENYEIIWNALITKYQDPRIQASRYIDQMINFKANQSIDVFIEQFCSAEAALRRLRLDNESDYMITHIALSKLEREVVSLFEQAHRHLKIPTFKDLTTFLQEQSKIVTLSFNSRTSSQTHSSQSKCKTTKSFVVRTRSKLETNSQHTSSNPLCNVCNMSIHPLYKCKEFIQFNPLKRIEIVNKHKFCNNCLGFHNESKCKSLNRCYVCKLKHHSLLHEAKTTRDYPRRNASSTEAAHALAPHPAPHALDKAACDTIAEASVNNSVYSVTCNTSDKINNTIVLLPTATVSVYSDNKCSNIRGFIDTGSMCHFITKACCKRLKLVISPDYTLVKGIGEAKDVSLGYTTLKIHSRFNKECVYSITARVIENITDRLPNTRVDTAQLSFFKNLPLADNQVDTPGDIDCLFGCELFPTILGSDKITSPHSSIIAVETTLGYILMGRAPHAFTASSRSCPETQNAERNFHCLVDNSETLAKLTERFWELESVPNKTHLKPEDEVCERLFLSTFSRDHNGRYTVHLPFKDDPSKLGDSYAIAKRRLYLLERKLDANPELRDNYNATLQGYINKDYLKEVKDPRPNDDCYYFPHRAVYRPEKATSNTRIVVDASCKTTSGKSLNDLLHKGPNLQTNIFDLLINLRMFSVALTADIEKMYFQIKLTPEHYAFQRILYRFNSDSNIRTFEFNRVSFGVSSSPYLAMRVVRHLASDSRDKWPLAAYEAENHMYMDDYVGSTDSLETAERIYHEMVDMFMAGGFKIEKWISNKSELMNKIPLSHKNPKIMNFDDNPEFPANTRIIGMQWLHTSDNFQFKLNSEILECTKRSILSVTARLFDPLGLIGPVVAFMKLLVQECWLSNLDWDDPVPESIKKKWIQFQSELPSLELIQIPRHLGITLHSHNILIGFADASERCYGAVVYLRTSADEHSGGVVKLLTSKSRVASLKQMSIARLELCAALLLSSVIDSVRETLNNRCQLHKTIAFSDSTVTLTWIHSPAYKFKTFIANRISEINSKLPACHWFHVRGQENPADIISRPVTLNALLNRKEWFYGPQWLSLPMSEWPICQFQVNNKDSELLEAKTVSLSANLSPHAEMRHPMEEIAERISSWSRLLRIIVYVLRFTKRLHRNNSIAVSDIDIAERYVLRYVQQKHFAQEFRAIRNNKVCSKRLRKLNPFIDDNDLLRVGGRLTHSQLDYGQKHPILVPTKDRISQLIVDYYHLINLHTGPELLLALIRQRFWILSARNLVRQRVHSCNICFKINPESSNPLMGNLPSFRVSEAKAFVYTAVDYCGPFSITHIRRRGVKSQKAYICLFVCLSTKALHLELVSDLSSELFLDAFKRFISRRGPVSLIYSDGGTNFIGAKRKLDNIYKLLQSTSHNNYLSEQLLSLNRIEFKRSPPYGPHFNGLCEVNVRCVKTHLFKIIGSQILTYEEFQTVIIQIEGILNSRPLCVLSSDPSDVSALTPNHFLNVTPLKFLPAENLVDISENRLSRFQLISKLTHNFWRRWSQEYLTSLQQREKWNTPTNPIKLGSIVMVKDKNAHPLCWPMGVVEALYPGKDGIIRTIKVRTNSGTYIRPVVRICPLPTQ